MIHEARSETTQSDCSVRPSDLSALQDTHTPWQVFSQTCRSRAGHRIDISARFNCLRKYNRLFSLEQMFTTCSSCQWLAACHSEHLCATLSTVGLPMLSWWSGLRANGPRTISFAFRLLTFILLSDNLITSVIVVSSINLCVIIHGFRSSVMIRNIRGPSQDPWVIPPCTVNRDPVRTIPVEGYPLIPVAEERADSIDDDVWQL